MKHFSPTASFAITLLLILNSALLSGQANSAGTKAIQHIDEHVSANEFGELIWSDEFTEPGMIDTSKWFHQTRLPNGSSWYNSEVQHYTNRIENSYNDSGYLHIAAIKEPFTDQGVSKQYTSARLNSKFAFTYGKVEIRAILPTGVGTWPAMWTLGKNITEPGAYWETQGFGTTGWPACGEIDIMEHWGRNQDYVSSAIHTPSSYGNTVNVGGRTIAGVSDDFHVYSLEWTPDEMVFRVDNQVHYVYAPDVKTASTWPFDEEQYLLLNVAMQPEIAEDFTRSEMIIDYVRVYAYPGTTVGTKEVNQSLLFPNPVGDKLSIRKLDPSVTALEVYDMKGLLVSTIQLDSESEQVDLSALEKGMYTVTLISGDETRTEKIIKQ